MKRQGILVYNARNDSFDVRFDLLEFYGGVPYGASLDVLIGNEWIPTRLQKHDFWYLAGIRVCDINGLIVRI